jgi:hypothetical protein
MYKLTNTSTIIRLSDNASIPADPSNMDYAEFLKWRDGWEERQFDFEGNELEPIFHDPHTPEPADPILPVKIMAVTMRQARLALLQTGKLAMVEQALDALPEPTRTAAKIEWDYSSEVQRTHPFTASMISALGMTEEDADALFAFADTL